MRYNFLRQLLSISLFVSLSAQTNADDIKPYSFQQQNYIVYSTSNFKQLRLALQDQNKQLLQSFAVWQQQFKSCESLKFAMNAGMYHVNYMPVGLYIENRRQLNGLNTAKGFGNFFLQPNGVVAWNDQKAVIMTTAQWQSAKFDAQYATQSGPMLLVNGKINSKFSANSESKKIRNGVGLKDGKLYFVISQNPVSFYQFSQFFLQGMGIKQALYLDGTISSIYSAQLKRNDHAYKLGPMLGVVESKCPSR